MSATTTENAPKRQRTSVDAEDMQETEMNKQDTRLPVTVLSGFLGSGKTTTLTHLLNNNKGLKIALIVNDMASVNVDALEINKVVEGDKDTSGAAQKKTGGATKAAAGGDKKQTETNKTAKPKMVALQNGCICCTLREDLVEQVAELAKDNKYDYLIIESTGISEPVPVAQTFCHSLKELEQMAQAAGHHHDNHDHDHESVATDQNQAAEDQKKLAVQAIELQNIAKLDTMVTVVDAAEIFDVLGSLDSLRDSKWSKSEAQQSNEDEGGMDLDRSIVDLLVDQIEFANVILLNKKDLLLQKNANPFAKKEETNTEENIVCGSDKVTQIEALVKKLNPSANVYWTEHGKVDPEKLLGTNLFNFEVAQRSAGWLQELANDGHHVPETEEYGISSVVFRSKKPFVPTKLHAILNGFGRISELVKPPTGGKDKKVVDETATQDEKQIFKGVIRSKGQIWLANACGYRMDWHSTGRQFSLNPGQPFDAAIKDAGFEQQMVDQNGNQVVAKSGDATNKMEVEDENPAFGGVFGDRETEIVVIGIDLDKKAIEEELENTLVTDEEMTKAAEEKEKFDKFMVKTAAEGGEQALISLTEKQVMKGTGGLKTPWDRFLKYEDPFFGGKAIEEFMEYRGDDEEEEEEGSEAGDEKDDGEEDETGAEDDGDEEMSPSEVNEEKKEQDRS
ncbi:unnamed protein product [Amoebophrya sp. A120]|nr:unnamed protein product [Amoebophrya sp. A120]|eukprot:GSA120T00001039001.1